MPEALHFEPAAQEAPANALAEACVIGSILLNNAAYDSVADVVKPEHFYHTDMAEMFRLVQGEITAGRKVSPVTIAPQIRASEYLGAEWQAKNLPRIISAGDVRMAREAARSVAACWVKRSIQSYADEMRARAANSEATADDILTEALEHLEALAKGADASRPAVSAYAAGQALMEETNANWQEGRYLSGLDTGFAELNNKIRGFRPGAMYVVAARPGMGKSAFALSLAVRMAQRNGRGLFWSGEMSAEELMGRAIAAKVRMPLDMVLTGMDDREGQPERVLQRDMARMVNASIALKEIPLSIDDREGITVPQLLSRARQMKRSKQGLQFVVVDYMALLRPSAIARKSGNRTTEMTEISADLARMARELKVPVIALSQLNRQSENREDRRPMLSDLRDSGAIEQDARCVIGLYREEETLRTRLSSEGQLARNANEAEAAYEKRRNEFHAALERSKGKAEAIVLKNRGGRTGIVDMLFDGPCTWFRDVNDGERSEAW
ncbi:DnaB-like helicase C-terminal domain-containing protein [Komagataeibacter xylinus]|uniref:replicative DNA helicase n=1 Tax=Komagataeibacter xylinus TaxID=28448 RepID=UPI00280A7298|nr:DnaB-like helicase C-terminal domain-containing protein [Komagataeibacter xylinus]